ncbi:hypothetical protein [Candidatus Palauibacter sp.]|uniref:hypothetical protein n=1 Tax=Candidatus Palauibacter sp. TaxID=3101350 RepID=UPI003B523C3A
MGAELIGILAVGAALAGLTLSTSHRHRDDMKSLRGDLGGQINDPRGEMRGLREEMRGEIHGVRSEVSELRSETRDLRGEMHGFRVEITDRVARIEAKVFNGAVAGRGTAG